MVSAERLDRALASLDRITDLAGFHFARLGVNDEETREAIAEAQAVLDERHGRPHYYECTVPGCDRDGHKR